MPDGKIFAVTGRPILHSRSPDLFNGEFMRSGRNAVYLRMATGSLDDALFLWKELDLAGMNVTAPYKEGIMDFMDKLEPPARMLGGANTVIRTSGGMTGHNTDSTGAVEALRSRGIDPGGRICAVLGAGPAARAAAAGLTAAGADVTLINRTRAKAAQWADRLGCRAEPMENLAGILEGSDILVSALRRGIQPVRKEWIRPPLAVLDANYPESPLVRLARSRGCTALSGETWLFFQAVDAFRLFWGADPDQEGMRAGLEGAAKDAGFLSRVCLIGFPGSGKSTVGELLARHLGWGFKDTDRMVEEKQGMSVVEIFHSKGEDFFRAEEEAAIERMTAESNCVYACGGGAVLSPRNRNNLQRYSLVIWLYASLSACLERVGRTSRPLIKGEDYRNRAKMLLDQRRFQYAASADIVVSTEKETRAAAELLYEEINLAV